MTALEYLKARSRKDALVLIISDSHAKRMMVAWTYHPHDWKDYVLPDDISPKEAMKAIWRSVEIDEGFLARVSNIPQRMVREKIESLKQCALIYPDGTAYDLALRVIANEVATMVARSLPEKA